MNVRKWHSMAYYVKPAFCVCVFLTITMQLWFLYRHSPKIDTFHLLSNANGVVINSKRSLASLADNSKSSLVEDSKSSLVKDSKSSLVEDSKSSLAENSKSSLVKDSKSSLVKDSKSSLVEDSKSSLVKDSKSSLVKDSKSSLVKDSKSSLAENSKSSLVKDSKSSLVKDSKSSLVKDSKSSLVKDSKNSLVKDSKSSLVKDSKSSLAENSTRSLAEPRGQAPNDIDKNDDHYLLPTNFILANRYPNGSGNEIIQRAIKEGHGLEPYTSERGEKCWKENGVLYRPFHELNSTSGGQLENSPFRPQYEEYVPFDKDIFFKGRGRDLGLSNVSTKKVILWYTKAAYVPPTPGLNRLRVCPDFPCVVSTNKVFINYSNALLFSAPRLELNPPPRRPDQVFIFHNHETPSMAHFWHINRTTSTWKSAFNWTMTFRMDSDIPAFYGVVRKRPSPLNKDYRAILSKKKKTVAWMSSNCVSRGKRDNYVKELQKYIPVDVYGGCGPLKCGRRAKDDVCMNLMSTDYKFYLSFESTLCEDYITEKFFKYATLDLITVGRASNEYHRHAPSDIFINAADFASPKELAARLKQLDGNDDEYIEMLRKKDEYMFVMEDNPIRNPGNNKIRYMSYRREEVSFCYVCYRLWNLHSYSKTVPNIYEWSDRGNKCKNPKGNQFLKK